MALAKSIAEVNPHCGDQLILSEVNWPLDNTDIYSPTCSPYLFTGQTVEGGVTEEEYGVYMLRYYLLALCSGIVEEVYWWRLAAHGYGLIDDLDDQAWRERPGYLMLRTFISWVGNARFVEKLPSPDGCSIFMFKRPDGQVFHVAYTFQSQGAIPITGQYQSAQNVFGESIDVSSLTYPPDGSLVFLSLRPISDSQGTASHRSA